MKRLLLLLFWLPAICYAQRTIISEADFGRVYGELSREKMPDQPDYFEVDLSFSKGAIYLGYDELGPFINDLGTGIEALYKGKKLLIERHFFSIRTSKRAIWLIDFTEDSCSLNLRHARQLLDWLKSAKATIEQEQSAFPHWKDNDAPSYFQNNLLQFTRGKYYNVQRIYRRRNHNSKCRNLYRNDYGLKLRVRV